MELAPFLAGLARRDNRLIREVAVIKRHRASLADTALFIVRSAMVRISLIVNTQIAPS